MIDSIFSLIAGLITGFIETTKYPGIFLLMFLESALVPFPSEVTVPFSAFLSSTGKLNVYLVFISSILGNILGAAVSYNLGKKIGEESLRNFTKKYGKFFLLTEKKLNKSLKFFERYGIWSILIARFIPGLRVIISLPAGITNLNFGKFILISAVGSSLWIGFLMVIGYKLGENWQSISPLFHKFNTFIYIFFIAAISLYLIHLFYPFKKKSNN